ncbi:MAG TPA: tetraacyldisaccharide 4'-kinase [bacterium]|nr:tetraacyldisaccharide 4'-kinase [bacterium]HPN30630.1 tetraacyldisaccharide 4'-kinase [bacterium]
MKNSRKLEFIWHKQIAKQSGLFYLILKIFSGIYFCIIWLKHKASELKLIPVKTFDNRSIISVGNITVGGTGKTPMVEYISNLMTELNMKTVIVSRGYGSQTIDDTRVRIVSNGRDLLLKQVEAGDEPYMLALKLKKIPIIVNKNRIKAIDAAINLFDPEIILLDDGFQRLNLKKNIEILMFDGTADLKLYKMFPAGILRDLPSAMRRADVCVINKIRMSEANPNLIDFIRFHNNSIPIFFSNYKLSSLHRLTDDSHVNFPEIENKSVTLFAGIGNVKKFKDMVKTAFKPKTINFIKFPDHHNYNPVDVKRIQLFCKISDYVITTYKDAVKLKDKFDYFNNILYTVIDMEMEDEQSFKDVIHYYLKDE